MKQSTKKCLFCFQENVSLIKEINDLRKELKIVRVKNHDLEAALGLHRKKNADVSQLLQAVTSQNKNAMMEEDLKEKTKVSSFNSGILGVRTMTSAQTVHSNTPQVIDIQRLEIKKLRTQITDLELSAQRPGSGQRLPPMPTQVV